MCQSLFLIKYRPEPATLLKKRLAQVWVLRNFQEYFFHRAPLGDCLWKNFLSSQKINQWISSFMYINCQIKSPNILRKCVLKKERSSLKSRLVYQVWKILCERIHKYLIHFSPKFHFYTPWACIRYRTVPSGIWETFSVFSYFAAYYLSL